MSEPEPTEEDLESQWRTTPEYTTDENGRLVPVVPEPDFGLLDVCVSRVIEVTRHPKHLETVYVLTLDTGRYTRKRKAASMLVDCYEPMALKGRLVLAVLNVRPMFNRDLIKRFLLMCAQNRKGGRFELLDPPDGSVEGDSVVVEGYPPPHLFEMLLGKYERKKTRYYFLPYKANKDTYYFYEYDETKSMFDSTAAELWMNNDRVAEFMGIPLKVEGKGVVTSKSFKDCPIAFE